MIRDHIAVDLRLLGLETETGRSLLALLGHMLFMGDGVLDQRVRGLMWLEFAKDVAPDSKDQWIRELYKRDFQVASDSDRREAAAMHEALAKGTPPIRAGSRVTSFLGPSGEGRVIPRRIVDANADEPAKQEVELQPIHQLPLRADRIERLHSIARMSFSGGIDGLPIGEYSVENSPARAANASFTIARIVRSG